MSKVAVFGGSGFLGTYIVNELLQRNHEAYSIDIKSTDLIPEKCFIEASITDTAALERIFKEHNFDVVFNLAGFANLDKSIHDPISTFQLNVMGNLNLLEESKKNGVKRFVFASSAYAMSDKGSFYGISKLSSEKLVEEYKKRYDLDFSILRFGSVYSERSYENNYIYNLIEKALESNTIDHSGDGEEIREYIHAFDAAKLSVDIIENEKHIGAHLMLTGVERMRRVELFEMIKEITGNSMEINLKSDGYQNHYKFTPYSFSPENSYKLTPNPYIDMGQGILNCIKEISKSTSDD